MKRIKQHCYRRQKRTHKKRLPKCLTNIRNDHYLHHARCKSYTQLWTLPKHRFFTPPSSTLDPTVASLLAQNDIVVQSGVKYCEYVKIRPGDGIELTQNSRLMNYYYKVKNT